MISTIMFFHLKLPSPGRMRMGSPEQQEYRKKCWAGKIPEQQLAAVRVAPEVEGPGANFGPKKAG